MQMFIVFVLGALCGAGVYVWQKSPTLFVLPQETDFTEIEMPPAKESLVPRTATSEAADPVPQSTGVKNTSQPAPAVKATSEPASVAPPPPSQHETSEHSTALSFGKERVQEYSPEKLQLAHSNTVLIFFHAQWCPLCRALDAEVSANPNIIPNNVYVLKVNYDTALDLRRKYGVTLQHTFVQVKADGEMIGKWANITRYAHVLARVQ